MFPLIEPTGRFLVWFRQIEEIIAQPADTRLLPRLKAFERAHTQMGGKDRKRLRNWTYSYFRLGDLAADWPIKNRLILGFFLSNAEADALFISLNLPEWEALIDAHFEAKWKWILSQFPDLNLMHAFPQTNELSLQINKELLIKAQFNQSLTWIRLNEKGEKVMPDVIREQSLLPYTVASVPRAYGFNQGIQLDKELDFVRPQNWWVQDVSSQACLMDLPLKENMIFWDCCSGSGGKSLLAKSLEPAIKIFVSDKRPSILEGLKARFEKHNIRNFFQGQVDLLEPLPAELQFWDQEGYKHVMAHGSVDMIVIDAPCSGSGTWQRDPDAKFDGGPKTFPGIQKSILKNVMPFLKKDGELIYLTCSVYAAENEKQFDDKKMMAGWELKDSKYFNFLEERGDVIYRAVLKRK